MKVIFKHTGGREQAMKEREARILQKLGRGTYVTRDMRAAVEPSIEDILLNDVETDEQQDDVQEEGPKRRGRKPKSESRDD